MNIRYRLGIALLLGAGLCVGTAAGAEPRVSVEPLTRYVHIEYAVPDSAPDAVTVACEWRQGSAGQWHPARVMPYVSQTGLNLMPGEVWRRGQEEGRIIERRAAGLDRTVVFNPYPEAQRQGIVDGVFRIRVLPGEASGADVDAIAAYDVPVHADNRDVVYIEDWSKVFQHAAIAGLTGAGGPQWTWDRKNEAGTFGNALLGDAGPDTGLPQLSYPLDLRGDYAVFVCTPPGRGIRLRFTGGERKDRLSSPRPRQEILWQWTPMDRQHLVLKQTCAYTGWTPCGIDYVKLVPLTPEQTAELDRPFQLERDKIVAAYWEPYSYAFSDRVTNPLWHREYLTAYEEGHMTIVDAQIGRFGAKVVYESRLTDQLLYATRGDPIGTVAHPTTDNVGRMQQFTNTLDATLRYAREMGLRTHANFGATNCYPGSPLQGQFSKDHPEWMSGHALRYDVPEVREYILTLYREALEVGAPSISVDFCRYPDGIDSAETANTFMRELRRLADEFSRNRPEPVRILVRFPGTGVRRHEYFDYATWVREGLVDYLCPSNIQGRHLHIGIRPYLEAAAGTPCLVLPALDGLSWGQPLPGPFLWRVAQVYEQGAPGIYVYQADSRLLGAPSGRRTMRLLASSEAVRAWWQREEALRPHRSKDIYITGPLRVQGWYGWHRLRAWVDGVAPGPVEFHLDGTLVNRCEGAPYLLGTEDTASDGVIPTGEHTVLVRARDGEGWLEREFTVHGAG